MTDPVMLVTIDTEQDCSATWVAPVPLTFASIHDGIVGRLQPLCDSIGARPTYLLSPSVIQDPSSAQALAGLPSTAELGTHLHGEFVEPARSHFGLEATATNEMQCFYPDDVEAAKLETLTELFVGTFGYSPASFRAGRFAADADTLRHLIRLGYRVDSSVTPHEAWEDAQGTVDHRMAPEQPYYPSSTSIVSVGSMQSLEVPVTIASHGALRRRYAFARRVVSAIPRMQSTIGRPLWLRPSFSSARDMRNVIDWSLATRATEGHPIVLNMMFHSVELTPSTSPYAASEEAAASLLARVGDTLRYAAAKGCRFATLGSLAAEFSTDESA